MPLDTGSHERDLLAPESAPTDSAPTNDADANDVDAFDALLARIAEAPAVPFDLVLTPGTRVSGYEIADRIGQGAFGAVYRAVHPLIGKEVAVKVLSKAHTKNPQLVRRFIEEARAVSRLQHPNVTNVFGFGELQDGTPYIVMELLRGQTLAELLVERLLPVERVVSILGQIAAGLEAAHAAGILHRDLKPANVFLTGDIDGTFETKLLDFGIAKLLDGSTQLTDAGVLIGTPSYMSPEQCAGEPLRSTSDIYALGVLAFELLTGQHPFSRESNARVLVQHLVEIPARVSEVANHLPRAFDAPVAAMLEKDPTQRPQSATQAVEGLRRALEEPRASRPSSWQKLVDWAGRRRAQRWLYTLVALSLVAALCIGTFGAARKAKPAERPAAGPVAGAASSPTVPLPAPVVGAAASEAEPAIGQAKRALAPDPTASAGERAPQRERAAKPARRKLSPRGELEF